MISELGRCGISRLAPLTSKRLASSAPPPPKNQAPSPRFRLRFLQHDGSERAQGLWLVDERGSARKSDRVQATTRGARQKQRGTGEPRRSLCPSGCLARNKSPFPSLRASERASASAVASLRRCAASAQGAAASRAVAAAAAGALATSARAWGYCGHKIATRSSARKIPLHSPPASTLTPLLPAASLSPDKLLQRRNPTSHALECMEKRTR